MGSLHHIVKVRYSEKTGEMRPVQAIHCPFKNGLKNTCVGDTGARCEHMFKEPAAVKKSDRTYMIHCGYQNG